MIPSQGTCHAVFLLVRTAHLVKCASIKDWAAAGESKSKIMASALNLRDVAEFLVITVFAHVDAIVYFAPQLSGADGGQGARKKVASDASDTDKGRLIVL